MNFDTYLIDQCKAITKEVKDHPLSIYFREPLAKTTTKEFMDDYLITINRPMDLSTVQQNLQSNVYKNFQCWANDMFLIFDNAITFNKPFTAIGGVAQYFKNLVQKRIEKLYSCNMRNYEAKLFQLIKEVNTLLENPPFKISCETKSKDLPLLDDFSKTRIEKLVRSLNTLCSNKKFPQIYEVLQKCGEQIDLNTTEALDIAGISRHTILELEKFVNDSKQ